MNKHDTVKITVGRVERLEAKAEQFDTMLAALKQLVERVNDVCKMGRGQGMYEPEMAEARSAIRKAEGSK